MTDYVYHGQVELIEQSDTQLELNLYIPENLYYFQGHFPEAAILPGVVLVDWVMNYLAQYFLVDKTSLLSIDALKFQQIIRPNTKVSLQLKKIKTNKYSFSYYSTVGQYASGKVVLA